MRRCWGLVSLIILAILVTSASWGRIDTPRNATYLVAPFDAPDYVKNGADLVLTGENDQVGLLASITAGDNYTSVWEVDPGTTDSLMTIGRHSVTWFPGTYNLESTFTMPETAEVAIYAEGTHFNYTKATGDAVQITGATRSTIHLGTIESASSGVALNLKTDNGSRRIQFNNINFQGLIGTGNYTGIGLNIDNLANANFIKGTDVFGFGTGVAVPGGGSGVKKTDTNVIDINYIRRNKINVDVGSSGEQTPDSFTWNINVDASLPNSIGIRDGGHLQRWNVTIGTWGDNSTPLEIMAGATGNIYNFRPGLETQKPYRDYAHDASNILLHYPAKVYVYASANLTTNAGTYTVVEWDRETYDLGMHSTISNPSRLVANVAGTYDISAAVSFAENANGLRTIVVNKNGIEALAQTTPAMPSDSKSIITIDNSLDLQVGDYVELYVWQNSGGSLNVLPENQMSSVPGHFRMALR